MPPFWRHYLFLFNKFFLVRVENVNGGNQGGKAPHGEGQFVGVQEVVKETVDEIADEGEGGTQYQDLGLFVLATAIGLQAAIHRHDDQNQYEKRAYDALFGQGTEILGVGIAAIACIGADDGLLLRHLIRRIHELVGAWSPTKHRTLIEQTEGRLPAVDTLEVGGIGGDVGDGLYVFHKVARSILARFLISYITI